VNETYNSDARRMKQAQLEPLTPACIERVCALSFESLPSLH